MRTKLLIILAIVFSMAAIARAEDRFVTSYWYGPPPKFTTIEHYRRIKEANFNVVFPPGPPDTSITREQNLKILDFCHELGMKAVIFEPRSEPETPAEPPAPAQARIEPEAPAEPEAAPNARLPLAEWPGPPLAEAVVVRPPEDDPPEPPPPEPTTGDAETDLDAMLFEKDPQGDPDPAALLLGDPEPEPEPDSDPAASLLEPMALPGEPARRPQRLERPTGPDPLAPLKAMSDAERIALFE